MAVILLLKEVLVRLNLEFDEIEPSFEDASFQVIKLGLF